MLICVVAFFLQNSTKKQRHEAEAKFRLNRMFQMYSVVLENFYYYY